jgi:glycosyltransferase involved in cell wall biosynthesis
VHINGWSGRLVKELGDIVRRVSAAAAGVTFVVNPTLLPPETRVSLKSEFPSLVQVLPGELTADDYFAQLSRCTVVLLAYEPQAYTSGASGVFVEAAGLGKPVVVPSGTWMAQQIEAGFAVGMTFEESSADSVTKALLLVLRRRA